MKNFHNKKEKIERKKIITPLLHQHVSFRDFLYSTVNSIFIPLSLNGSLFT